MPGTYDPIATVTLTATSTSMTVTNLPSTYTDLVISAYMDGVTESYAQMQLNSDTGTNYDYLYMGGVASVNITNRTGSITSMPGSRADEQANIQYHLFNYTSTSNNKVALIMNANPSIDLVYHAVAQWRSTAAVTSISINSQSGHFAAGSTFTVYGILRA